MIVKPMTDKSGCGQSAEVETRRRTRGGKRQFLVYLEPEIIRDVKMMAAERDTSASQLVGEALSNWLRTTGSR